MSIKTFWNGPTDFGESKVKGNLKKALDKSAKKAEKLLLQPTSSWQHKVSFPIKNDGETAEVLTSDVPYAILDDGAAPHRISGNPTLAFPSVFRAKTTVGSLNAGPGAVGGSTVYTQEVNHPGVKSRDFTGQTIKQIEDPFLQDIQDALDDAIA